MQQPTIRQLYAYWDRMRNGRTAPRRFEIQPADIAALLPETFIAERMAGLGLRFRLAGTKICENFGRELRGVDFLTFWEAEDRAALASLLRNVFADAAVGHGTFRAFAQADREASFEFLLLPLIHNGDAINRLLGAIVATDPAFWLGTQPFVRHEIVDVKLHWPDGFPAFIAARGAEIVRLSPRRFRVVEGGLAEGE
jgi:hypothetical protein